MTQLETMERTTKMRKPQKTEDFIAEVESRLVIDQHALDVELIAHPEVYYEIGARLALWTSDRDDIKTDLVRQEAAHYLKMRLAAEETGAKVTEAFMKQTLAAAQPTETEENLGKFNRMIKALEALKESWYQRGHALRELCKLYELNYFQTNRVLETKSMMSRERL